MAVDHYRYVDKETGEVIERLPEFAHMSLKPGIGAAWLDRYMSDVYPDGSMVVRGFEGRAPRYYDKKYKKLDPEGFERLKVSRRDVALDIPLGETTDARNEVRRAVQESRERMYKRNKF